MMGFGIETETLEFKKTTAETKEAINSICAILNKHGKGEVYFGIASGGKIIGQTVTEQTLRDIGIAISNAIAPKIYPEISCVTIEDKNCIRIKFEGVEQPYYANGKAKIRVADSDLDMSPSELERYILNKNSFADKWENKISNTDIEAVDEKLLKRYLDKAKDKKRINLEYTDKKTVLNKLFLTLDGKLLNAGKVLFCESEMAELQMAIFATGERLTFNDIKRMHGDIFTLIDAAELYVRSNINWKVKFDGSMQRKEIPEIPVEALREAIVNSFCHKNYAVMEANEVAIFKDRIEIYNPGSFPSGYQPEDFIKGSERPVRRNPLIAQILYYSQDAENFGTGLKRIVQSCSEAGIKVEFKTTKAGFVSVFYRPQDVSGGKLSGKSDDKQEALENSKMLATSRISEQADIRNSVEAGGKSGDKLTGKLNLQNIDRKILSLCCEKDISATEIAKELGYTKANSYIRGKIAMLRENGLLEYTIPDKPNSRLQKYKRTVSS